MFQFVQGTIIEEEVWIDRPKSEARPKTLVQLSYTDSEMMVPILKHLFDREHNNLQVTWKHR